MDDLQLVETLASLKLQLEEQKAANQYVLSMVSYFVNPNNPEHAYSHFQARQQAYVFQKEGPAKWRQVLADIDRAKELTK